MGNYLSFDIEIADELSEGKIANLENIHVSVGALCTDAENVEYFEGYPSATKETCQKMVSRMYELYKDGYIPFGWNTLSFDFPILAYQSGMVAECAEMALNSVDGMFLVVAQKGFMLGLDKALIGADIETKLHKVTLNDGTALNGMNGSKAPSMWFAKEFKAVKDYLAYDVWQPLKLANHIETSGCIHWTSNAGKPNSLYTKMLTVKECLSLPPVDVSWMTDPKPRGDFYRWIPKEILDKELV